MLPYMAIFPNFQRGVRMVTSAVVVLVVLERYGFRPSKPELRRLRMRRFKMSLLLFTKSKNFLFGAPGGFCMCLVIHGALIKPLLWWR